ncbi:hypothetical protein ACTHUR_16415, partial [Neisseria sp. P0021.S007]|uniref:hypothetical protein n=1 Tax=Neisseria sp. P0021.S007 TaxID=3436822 RepID=UPI003F7E6A36
SDLFTISPFLSYKDDEMPEYSGLERFQSTYALYSNSEIIMSSKKCGIALFLGHSGQNHIFCNIRRPT